MLLTISDILTPEQASQHVKTLAEGAFVPGATTAGWHAKDVKHNEQAQGPAVQAMLESVQSSLLNHPVFKAAARPKAFVRVLASRYQPGMAYGTHVDDALMGGVRTDMSFTLFLADPASYDGGELVIEGTAGETDVKLDAGSLVLYPTTSPHRVNAVTRGERLAIVGWVRSFIRSPEQRQLLFEMDQLVASLRAEKAGRNLLDQTLKVRNSLIRMWAED